MLFACDANPAGAADPLRARLVATLTNPVALAVRAGETNNVYIANKNGVVQRLTILNNGGVSVSPTAVINLSDRVLDEGEQGLLGIAFKPDGTKLYAYWTGTDGNNGVYEYPYANGVANKAQQRRVLWLPHPTHANHNGGNIAFGPGGFLYIGTGDGGGGGDPSNNAQNLNSLHGKILRLNPSLASPTPEIRHYGLRNPWRWSFDRSNGNLWIGDVGQRMFEEVDRVGPNAPRANFGWNRREGLHPYNGGTRPPGNVDPIFEYSHNNGNCSITGGYVYRGTRLAGWQGVYFYADFCVGNLRARSGATNLTPGVHVDNPSAFGQDASGELWILSLNGPVHRLVKRAT